MNASHEPVLLPETIRLLAPKPAEVALDCTFGLGGHASAVAECLGPKGKLIGFDHDPANLLQGSQRVTASSSVSLQTVQGSFDQAPDWMAQNGLQADLVLADLGFSSNQMDDPERGFSFSNDGPLDMRMDQNNPRTAAQLVAELDQYDLTRIIRDFGDEPLAHRIARNLVARRQEGPISNTAQLVQIVLEAYGSRARSSRRHPATRTFMALRIAVNDELGALQRFLDRLSTEAAVFGSNGQPGWLSAGARVAIISFHSLEDRMVKRCFAELSQRGLVDRLTRQPVVPSQEEQSLNPRSRSAKLRSAMVGTPVQQAL